MDNIPNMKLIGDQFEGTILLPIWSDFHNKAFYDHTDSQIASDGIFQIAIGGDMSVENPTITSDHINAYRYLLTHSERISNILVTHLFSEYRNLQIDYAYTYDETDLKEMMPDINTIEQFKNLIALSQIHIMNVARDGFSYVGYELSCSWDEEHGLGFMTHKDRIIDFGGVDTSFMSWVAKKDLEK